MAPVQPHGTARTFTVGLAVGFALGAVVVCAVVWQYGNLIGARAAMVQSAGKAPAAVDRGDAGTEDVDAPVIQRGDSSPPPAQPFLAGTAPPPTATTEAGAVIGPAPGGSDDLADRELAIPVEGVRQDQLVRTFDDRRSSSRLHEAIDILAPTGTPVKAVEDGGIARLFYSKAGGITVYQFDPSEKYCYYYAHLDRYADGLNEGDRVRKGQVLGYVGTSGNAAKDTPHLHFAVFRLTAEKHWWEGTPIDPYSVLR